MITTTSLLDYIKQEDSLMKENDINFERKVNLLHYIDDSESYPTIYNTPKDELQKCKDEVAELEAEILQQSKKKIETHLNALL